MKRLDVVLRYEGKEAENGELDLYDAAMSLSGFARVLNLVVHAFANKNEARQKVPQPKNASTHITGAKKGCFEEIISVEFSDAVVERIGPSVITKVFWDYLAYSVSMAVGLDHIPTSPYVARLVDANESPFEEIAASLENALFLVHRPIKYKESETVKLVRPHVGDIVTMDKSTLAYVNTADVSEKIHNWTGNVTKYNLLTGYGRAYINELKRIIPFHIENFKENPIAHQAAVASMNERAHKEDGKRKILGYSVINATNSIKRIIITEIASLN